MNVIKEKVVKNMDQQSKKDRFIKENQCLLILKESQGDKRHKKC